jgi:toxin ParE1/3/4
MGRALVKDNAAESDLIGIWIYSFETWGEAQADRYLSALEHGIAGIARDPISGTDRRSLREGYWSKRVEHHVVFYTFSDQEVRIRRVLHEVMDVGRHV